MRRVLKQIALFSLAILVVSPLWAAQAEGKKKQSNNDKAAAKAFELPTTIVLTAEQQTQLEAVKTEFEPKLKETLKKQSGILTAEQKKIRNETTRSAKAAGEKGKELQAEVTAALNLTEEQKKQQEEVRKELKDLNGQIREKINTFLTADQKALLKAKKKAKPA